MGGTIGYNSLREGDHIPCSWWVRVGEQTHTTFPPIADLAFENLRGLIRIAKKFVFGWDVVDLCAEDAAAVWACFSIHDQQEFRRLRPADAGPGWMFSLDGVDVYEVPAPGGGTVLAAPPAPERAPGGSAMWFGRHAMGKDGPPVPGVYVGDRDDWMFYGLSRRDARQWASLLHRYAAGEAVPSCAPGEAPCEDFRLPEGE